MAQPVGLGGANYFTKQCFTPFGQKNAGNTVLNVVQTDTQQAIVATDQKPALTSRELIQYSFTEEISLRDQERFTQIQTLVNSGVAMVLANRKLVQEVLQNLWTKAKEIGDKSQTLLLQSYDLPAEIIESHVNKCNFLLALSEQVEKRHFETATQMSNMLALASEKGLKENIAMIECMALERLKELEIMNGRVNLLMEQENHELEGMVILQNQQLKQEAQEYDHQMRHAEFVEKQEHTKFEQSMQEREQKRRENVAYEELALKRLEINNHNDIERLKIANAKEIESAKLTLDSSRETTQHNADVMRIQAQERVQMAKHNKGCTLL